MKQNRFLYVCTDDFDTGPRLIGILTELKPGKGFKRHGEYEFKYTIGGAFHEFCLRLIGFSDPSGVYRGEEVFKRLVEKHLPEPDDDDILELVGQTENTYDEWECLKHFGQIDMQGHAFLHETLPERIVRFDKN
jgi:hypothetical protein